jgi:hypothetical protein
MSLILLSEEYKYEAYVIIFSHSPVPSSVLENPRVKEQNFIHIQIKNTIFYALICMLVYSELNGGR